MNTEKNGAKNIDQTIANAAGPTDVQEPAKHPARTLYTYMRDKMQFTHLAAVLAVHTLEKGGTFSGSGGTVEAFPGGVTDVRHLKPAAVKWLHANKAAIESWAEKIEGRPSRQDIVLEQLLECLAGDVDESADEAPARRRRV